MEHRDGTRRFLRGLIVGLAVASLSCQHRVNRESASEGGSTGAAPRLPIASLAPEARDLGVITDATPFLDVETRLTNSGTAALEIKQVTSSCGCTVVERLPNRVNPGASVPVRVRVSSGTTEGDRKSLVTIDTNDPHQPRLALTLTWNRVAELHWSPRELEFGGVEVDEEKSERLVFTRNPGSKAEFPSVESVSNQVRVEPVESTDENSRVYKVSIKGDRWTGKYSETLRIRSMNRWIPVRWEVASRLRVEPSALFSVGVERGGSLEATLDVSCDDPRDRVTCVRGPVGIVETMRIENRGLRSQRIHLSGRVPAGTTVKRMQLELRSDRKDAAATLVPWSIIARSP